MQNKARGGWQRKLSGALAGVLFAASAAAQDLDDLLGEAEPTPAAPAQEAPAPTRPKAEEAAPAGEQRTAEPDQPAPGGPTDDRAADEPKPAETRTPEEPEVEPRPRRVVEEIIVTAQKMEQTLREVPISLSVIDAEFIQQAGITDFRDLSLYVPNVSVNTTSATFNDVRIRGFGTPLTNKAFEQPVGLVLDGVPYGRLAYYYGPIFDVDRVEVLRGPQGTLFGKNTTSGLFNLVTKRPTDEYTGRISAELGEFDHRRFEAGIGGPLIAKFLNFRIAGLLDERDGFVENTTDRFVGMARDTLGGRSRKGVRAQLGFPDLLGTTLVVGYEHTDIEAENVPWEFSIVVPNQEPFYREFDPDADYEPGNFRGSIDEREFLRNEIDTLVANATYDIGDWSVDGVAGYSFLTERRLDDNDFGPSRMFPITNRDDNSQYSFEARLNSPDLPGFLGLGDAFGFGLGRSRFMAGLFFINRKITDSALGFGGNFARLAQLITTDATGVVPPCPGCDALLEEFTGFFDQGNDAYAGFTHLNWSFAERWTLEYGMRFTEESKDAEWSARCTTANNCPGFRGALNAEDFSASRSRSEFAFTPKVVLQYDVTDEIGVYGSYTEGSKAGGFNAVIFNDQDEAGFSFEPEKTTAWELGSKMSLLSGTATVNLALFRMDVEDLQVFNLTPDVQFRVENAAEARSQGVELDAMWLPLEWLTLQGALGFLDTEYLDFPIGTCSFDRTNTDGDSEPRCDLTGRPFEHTPKWTANLVGQARYPVTQLLGGAIALPLSGVDLVGGLNIEFKDDYFANITLDPRTKQSSFVRLNGNLGFGNVAQGWSLGVKAYNLTDEAVAVHIRDVSLVGKTFVQVVDPPRWIVGEFRWEF